MIRLLMGFLATIAFAVIYNVPKRALIPAGFVGTGALLIRTSAERWEMNPVAGVFLGAFFVSIASEILARVQKLPGTVFTISGILMLVPGTSALNTMRAFVQQDYLSGIANATQTLLMAGGVAAGLVLAGALVRMDRRKRRVAKGQTDD
ncbi:threonine/serine exporter family protein [Effusibacillus pohliae]|uniref:threonine/serine exporter family protein n=1 Tax=Effusibacillus pohliae TaxID=232270 RepID=UPI00036ABDE4|nr:threonine/serine exporter family protein [Effusibacillus pohliae]